MSTIYSRVASKTVLFVDFQNFIAKFNDAISVRVLGAAGFDVFLEPSKRLVAELFLRQFIPVIVVRASQGLNNSNSFPPLIRVVMWPYWGSTPSCTPKPQTTMRIPLCPLGVKIFKSASRF